MMLVFDLTAGLLLGVRNRGDIDRRELLRLAPFIAIGMLVGVTALYDSGGPIYTTYLARRVGDANRLRATQAVLIFCTAWARLVLFWASGLMLQPSLLPVALTLLPCAVLGYLAGSRLHQRLAPRHAARALWILLLASGGSLLWRARDVTALRRGGRRASRGAWPPRAGARRERRRPALRPPREAAGR